MHHNPYLPRPVSSEGSTHTRSAQKLGFCTGPCPSPCLSWAAGKPVPSLDPLLPPTTAQLDLGRASAGGTCPAVTGQLLLTLAAVSRPAPLFCSGSCGGTGMACLLPLAPFPLQCPLPLLLPHSQPRQGPKPRWSPQVHGWKVCGWCPR